MGEVILLETETHMSSITPAQETQTETHSYSETHKLTDAWMPLADTLTEDYTIYGAVQKETEINGSDLETHKEDQLLDLHLDLCQDLCQDQLLFLTSFLHQ